MIYRFPVDLTLTIAFFRRNHPTNGRQLAQLLINALIGNWDFGDCFQMVVTNGVKRLTVYPL